MINFDNVSEMSRAYIPGEVEEKIYDFWNNSGKFEPNSTGEKDPFVMIMPPPNVTGELHMGHALTFAVEDMIVRWHRMQGEPTLFLPGTDHAGIATQVVVERLLASEGVTRHDLGREEFEKRIWQWVDEYGERIYDQLRRLGTSCDWSRKAFTLDEAPQKAVRKTFVDLYKKGLIYKGERITNWCPRCSTALSDLEVKYKEESGDLYEIEYPLDGANESLVVATTRPETMFGDTAVAVNPSDSRYAHLIGLNLSLPLTDRKIPIIGDDEVEMDFGTGALKVTPGHDPTDFEIGAKHDLPTLSVIDRAVRMNSLAGEFEGLDRFECRSKVVELLESKNLLRNTEQLDHSIAHCDRCDEIIEPIVTEQWYVSMEPLAKPARNAVADGTIKIIPNRFTKVYFEWMDNIRDWPVSRQLWWGHKIPVWYCDSCNFVIVEYEDPIYCKECGSSTLTRDPDVLDTWFSSGLWTHSTLGWPDQTDDLERFYPGSVMETGYDILFFWVARMIMLGMENIGSVPFHTIYLHGLVLDTDGVKMSKTKGNVLDPLELIDEYGADAVRFALTTGTAAGNNLRMSEGKLESSRNFANKLWNSARYVLSHIENDADNLNWIQPEISHLHDRWIISRLTEVTSEVDKFMKAYQFGDAQREIHDFLWNEYCDWFIEFSKIRFRSTDGTDPLPVLIHVLEKILRLLHPFMPFVTEEIWGIMRNSITLPEDWPDSLIIAEYPKYDVNLKDVDAEGDMGILFELVGAIRNVRGELRIPQHSVLEANLRSINKRQLLQQNLGFIEKLAFVNAEILNDEAHQKNQENGVTIVTIEVTTDLIIGKDIDVLEERNRIQGEQTDLSKYMTSINKRLSNRGFTDKAPEEVVEKERERLERASERHSRLEEILKRLA